ncbi:MAG: Sapep family Mn(2+)-dependent dipeptidase [Ruminiclostridium sp.]|nr:Sapep family Mn(2+)-dependent dipeptidase [Ruminiclostridium sp.]
MQQRINDYFAGREDQLIEAVSRLVRIDSTLGEAQPGMPFGPGPAAALEEMLKLSAELGLPGENLEGYVGTVDLNDRETALHILGHLDVVDPGEGWTVTTAFEPKLVDGLLYGRGTDDDKGPMVAALLAMKAVKDLGIPLRKNVRMILGTDEETGFRDITWYYDRHPYAPYTISPDADFPIINIEKGHYQPTFSASWDQTSVLPRVTSLTGGPRLNMVPPKANAVVAGLSAGEIQAVIPTLGLEEAISFTLTQTEAGVHILAAGQGAHGSTPQEGHNAQTALVALLAALPLADCPSTQAIRTLRDLFPHGDFTGEALGLAQSDELSGHLSLAFTRIDLTDTGFEGRFDSRTPLCANDENTKQVTEAVMGRFGWTVTGEIDPPHHVPADSPFIQTLAKCYEMYSGRKSECLCIGGGTYVHGIPGGVAFGASMPGFVSNLHGPDEKVNVADLLTAAKIYTQVIIELCS